MYGYVIGLCMTYVVLWNQHFWINKSVFSILQSKKIDDMDFVCISRK